MTPEEALRELKERVAKLNKFEVAMAESLLAEDRGEEDD